LAEELNGGGDEGEEMEENGEEEQMWKVSYFSFFIPLFYFIWN
jgi:hypothetical protein